MQGLTSQFATLEAFPSLICNGLRRIFTVIPGSPALAALARLLLGKVAWLGAFCLLLAPAIAATAPDVTLAWNANKESDIIGYELCYGTESGRYPHSIPAGLKTRTKVSGLRPGTKYYFAVYAYNWSARRSRPSEEIVYTTAPLNQAPKSTILTPSSGGTIIAGESVDFSGGGSDPDDDTPLSYHWDFGKGSGIPDSKVKNPGDCRFHIPGTYQVTLTVTDSKGLEDPEPATTIIKVLKATTSIIPRSGWTLEYVNSEEANGFAATRSFDGNPDTFWHTAWRNSQPKPPHEIEISLGKLHNVNGFQYLPRQDNILVGNIGTYKFYVSMNGVDWGKPVATGSFANSTKEKRVRFPAKRAKFIRLVSLSQADGNNDCAVAELNILQGPPANLKPVAKDATLTTRKNKKVGFRLKGTDANKNPLTYEIVSRPKNGTLHGTLPNLTFTPKKGFTGTAKFTYRIHDGRTYSKPATVRIRVKPPASSHSLLTQKSAPTPAPESSAAKESPKTLATTTVIGGRKYLLLTVTKPAIPDGAKYTVQVSSDLLDWFSGKNHTTVLINDDRYLKVRDNTPLLPGEKRYIRLKPRLR